MDKADNRQAIDNLVRQLFVFARRWRTTDAQGRFAEADVAVQRYHATLAELWNLDWDADLHPEEELPDELMPAYYMAYWKQYRGLQRELAMFANQWRAAQAQGDKQAADAAVGQYHATLARFFEMAREDKRIFSPPEAFLPDELMPAYYLAYRQSKSQS